MEIKTIISEQEPPGMAAHFVGEVINGIAKGCRYLYPRWKLPMLYESGVDFVLPSSHGGGSEYFALPPVVYAKRTGDCDQLVIWRLIELQAHGEPSARCKADWMGHAVHVRIRRADGRIEDPSRVLLARKGVIVPEFDFQEYRPR